MDFFRKANELDPGQPTPCYRIGNELVQLGRVAEAAGHYARAAALDPEWSAATAATIVAERRLMLWRSWELQQREIVRRRLCEAQPFLATFQLPLTPAETLGIMQKHARLAMAPSSRRATRSPSYSLSPARLRVAILHPRPFHSSQASPHLVSLLRAWDGLRHAHVAVALWATHQTTPDAPQTSEPAWRLM